MNTDKPVDMANSSNVFGTNPNGSTSDLAQPVYTRGDVIVGGDVIVTGHIRSSPVTSLAAITGNNQNIVLDTSLGENFTVSSAGGFTGANFDISGTIYPGDIIRVFIAVSTSGTVAFTDGTNTSVTSATALASKTSILTFTSNGTKYYQTSFVTNLTT
jgi:hypothetical protein